MGPLRTIAVEPLECAWPETWYEVTKNIHGITAVECDRCTEQICWVVHYDNQGNRHVRRQNKKSDYAQLFRTFDEVKAYLKADLETSLRMLEFKLENLPLQIARVKTQLGGVDTLVPPVLQKPKVKTESTNGNTTLNSSHPG